MTSRRTMLGVILVVLLLAGLYFFTEEDTRAISAPAPAASSSLPIQSNEVPSFPFSGFVDADLHIGLEALCKEDDQTLEAADRAREEDWSEADTLDQQRHTIARSLSESSSAEHLYVAAMFEDDPAEKVELLRRAVTSAPTNAFLVWGAFEMCSHRERAIHCPMESWEQLLIDIDGGNSEAWVRIAANRFLAGDYEDALDAMHYAATSAETRIYWPETIEAIESGLVAGSDFTFEERAHWAFGVEAAIPRYADRVAMCLEMSSTNAEWAHVCLLYGQLVERQGKTELGVSVARAIQKTALRALGDSEAVEATEQRIEARRQMRLEEFGNYSPATEYLVMTNPALFHSFLAATKSDGEIIARRRLRAEVAQLLKEQPELACVPEQYRPVN